MDAQPPSVSQGQVSSRGSRAEVLPELTPHLLPVGHLHRDVLQTTSVPAGHHHGRRGKMEEVWQTAVVETVQQSIRAHSQQDRLSSGKGYHFIPSVTPG